MDENEKAEEFIFDPTAPSQVAARDRIFTMLESKWEDMNHVARLSSKGLRDLCNDSGHAIACFRFYAQVLLTEMESRKIQMGEVWPPNASDGYPLSPGWEFLSSMVADPDVAISADESIKEAAKAFCTILHEAIEDVMAGKCGMAEALSTIKPKIESEIQQKEECGKAATVDVVKHLGNWLWLLDKPDALDSMTARLRELAEDSAASGQLDMDGIVALQVHLEGLRKAREFVDENVNFDEEEGTQNDE